MECPSNVKVKYTQIFINNQWVDAVSGKTFPTINPSTGKKIIDIAEGDQADVDKAVEAAKKAFTRGTPWRTTDASGRATLINKLADLIERDSKVIAALESLDNGKPFQDALIDMYIVVTTLRYYAGLADKIHGNTIPADGPVLSMTRKEPVGVVGQIIPWNYPAAMLAWKWGPALATGCTIVMKPAEQTPLSALQICSLVVEAGFPPGVINVVPGYGPTAGAAIASHMGISKVAFTGSTAIGRVVMAAAANSNLKRVSLELGGKSPLVIFDDVNVDEAVNIAYDAIFSNAGQNCCAGSRTFVQDTIYDKFVEKAVAKALTRKVGDAFAEKSEQGPQIDDRMFKKVLGLIESGKKQGATLQCGGKQVGTDGYFIAPTIFSDVKDNMDIATDEIFGPVQSILKFSTLDEVIERANKTTYGLAAGVVTKNIDIALQFAQAVEAGSVWVNCYQHITSQTPFGGYKQSGIGRELGVDGLENYLETKTITIKLPTKE